jgi:hypothetical protein
MSKLIKGAIYRFDCLPGKLWKFTGETTRHGCQMHGDDVKTYGYFYRRRNNDVRPWSDTQSEFEVDLAIPVEPSERAT